MTTKEMQQKILNICKESTEKNPIVVFNRIVKNEDISIQFIMLLMGLLL
ncbi:MAG: hypothetical protein IJ312_07640 [Treponema sp.]|nr:hypothetical protein [Treponema sp.]